MNNHRVLMEKLNSNKRTDDSQMKLHSSDRVNSQDLQTESGNTTADDRVSARVRDIESPGGPCKSAFRVWNPQSDNSQNIQDRADNTTEFKKIYSDFQNTSNHKIDSSPTKPPTIKANKSSSYLHASSVPDLESMTNKRKAGSPIKQFTTENKKFHHVIKPQKTILLSFKDKSQLDLNYQNWLLLQQVTNQEKLLKFMKLERKFEQETV